MFYKSKLNLFVESICEELKMNSICIQATIVLFAGVMSSTAQDANGETNGKRCWPTGTPCDEQFNECCGYCNVLEGTCTGAKQSDGVYDLSPKDLEDLCKVVDPTGPKTMPTRECVYMKWIPCPGGSPDKRRPCGWYQQTKCEKNRRSKRSSGLAMMEDKAEEVFLELRDEM